MADERCNSVIVEKIKKESGHYDDNNLMKFESYNHITSSIYNLENYQVLMCHSNGKYFTNWDNIYDNYSYCSMDRSKPNPSILYISEDFTNKRSISKRKYQHVRNSELISKYQDPATDSWDREYKVSSKFSRLKSIVIIGITDKITDLSEMFYGSTVETISFVNCDFSNVKNTHNIFYGCNNLKTIHADEKSIFSLIHFVPESIEYIDNIPEFSESDFLNMINSDSISLRKAAIEHISDESILADIAKNDSDEDVRNASVEKISDKVLDYYCDNCCTDIPKSDYCPHCGNINIRAKSK